MNPRLKKALDLLAIETLQVGSSSAAEKSSKDQASALLQLLELSGFLSPQSINQAVLYLAAARPFMQDGSILPLSTVQDYLNNAIRNAKSSSDTLKVSELMRSFAAEACFEVDDIVDLITFLRQTAFDRKFGQERDKFRSASSKGWMLTSEYQQCLKVLGVATDLPVLDDEISGIGINGASIPRLKLRIDLAEKVVLGQGLGQTVKPKVATLWGLTGERELSLGLDWIQDEQDGKKENFSDVLKIWEWKKSLYPDQFNGDLQLIEKAVPGSSEKRLYADKVTETDAFRYYLSHNAVLSKVEMIDSEIEKNHWRATAKQNAQDVAKSFIEKIIRQEIKPNQKGVYNYLMVAEQPYGERMALQVQLAMNKKLQEYKRPDIKIEVKGYGPGIADNKLQIEAVAAVVSSEVAAKGAVEFEAARTKLALEKTAGSRPTRHPDSIMFQRREEYYRNNRPIVMLSLFADPGAKSDNDRIKLHIDSFPSDNTPKI